MHIPRKSNRVNSDTPEIKVVTPDEFNFALALMNAAVCNSMPVTNPETIRFAIEEPDGEIKNYHFTDRPLNRALGALAENFEQELAWALGMRWGLLNRYLETPAIKKSKYIRNSTDNDAIEIHPDLIEAVATLPYSLRRRPPTAALLKHLRKIESTKRSS